MRNARIFIALILSLGIIAVPCAVPAVAASLPEHETAVPVITDMKRFSIPDNDAMALMKKMKCGWNLGNTFEAFSGYTLRCEGIAMETAWGAPKATRKLISAVREAGFNAVRIPVSWHNHVDGNDRIDTDWLARVRQVAGLALEQDMYVIVNVHHDNDERWFYPDEEHYGRSSAYLAAVWAQLAEAFSDCDDRLILESMNEPRLVGTPDEWTWNRQSGRCLEAAGCINRLNQLFVDTVRSAGGNNAVRYLAVPAYCASPWAAADQAFQLPKDTAENRIIVEAHAYTPYSFALDPDSPDSTFDLDRDGNKKAEITRFLNLLYDRFVAKGIPVVMDEFGAVNKSENTRDRISFTAWYVASAGARGIPCFWWDNHNFTGGGERFGLLDRRSCSWVYPGIVRAIMENCLCNRD